MLFDFDTELEELVFIKALWSHGNCKLYGVMESFFLVCKKFQVKITDTAAVFNTKIYSNGWFYSQNEMCDFIRLMASDIATGSVFWLWNSIGRTCVNKSFMELWKL